MKSSIRRCGDELGNSHVHRPDFIVVLSNDVHLALEIKGYKRDLDLVKELAGRKWESAVATRPDLGMWTYHVCESVENLEDELRAHSDPLGGAPRGLNVVY